MSTKKWHILGFVFIFFGGIFLHFVYGLSNYNRIVGYFGATNESIWEHLKLIFWPGFIYSVVEYVFYGKKDGDFLMIKLMSVICAMALVVVLFYTYSGVLGFNLFVADIIIFTLAVLLCQLISYRLQKLSPGGDKSDNLRAMVLFVFVALCFVAWTYNAPELGIFWG